MAALLAPIPVSGRHWQLGLRSSSKALAVSQSRSPGLLLFVRASSSSDNTKPPSTENGTSRLPKNDVGYVFKLTIGSVVGAAAIKYGSILIPSITKPNLEEALLIMGSPVAFAVGWFAVASLKRSEDS